MVFVALHVPTHSSVTTLADLHWHAPRCFSGPVRCCDELCIDVLRSALANIWCCSSFSWSWKLMKIAVSVIVSFIHGCTVAKTSDCLCWDCFGMFWTNFVWHICDLWAADQTSLEERFAFCSFKVLEHAPCLTSQSPTSPPTWTATRCSTSFGGWTIASVRVWALALLEIHSLEEKLWTFAATAGARWLMWATPSAPTSVFAYASRTNVPCLQPKDLQFAFASTKSLRVLMDGVASSSLTGLPALAILSGSTTSSAWVWAFPPHKPMAVLFLLCRRRNCASRVEPSWPRPWKAASCAPWWALACASGSSVLCHQQREPLCSPASTCSTRREPQQSHLPMELNQKGQRQKSRRQQSLTLKVAVPYTLKADLWRAFRSIDLPVVTARHCFGTWSMMETAKTCKNNMYKSVWVPCINKIYQYSTIKYYGVCCCAYTVLSDKLADLHWHSPRWLSGPVRLRGPSRFADNCHPWEKCIAFQAEIAWHNKFLQLFSERIRPLTFAEALSNSTGWSGVMAQKCNPESSHLPSFCHTLFHIVFLSFSYTSYINPQDLDYNQWYFNSKPICRCFQIVFIHVPLFRGFYWCFVFPCF